MTRPLGGYVADLLYRSFGTRGKKLWTLLCGLIMGAALIAGGFYIEDHHTPTKSPSCKTPLVLCFVAALNPIQWLLSWESFPWLRFSLNSETAPTLPWCPTAMSTTMSVWYLHDGLGHLLKLCRASCPVWLGLLVPWEESFLPWFSGFKLPQERAFGLWELSLLL